MKYQSVFWNMNV